MRTLALVIAAALVCSCTSASQEPSPRLELWKTGMKESGKKVASATARGAEVVGESMGTAYHGVTNGFAEPDDAGYGPYPRDYLNAIRKHMVRSEGVKDTARIQIGTPARSYLNDGLLRGGAVDWQGWVVDITVETKVPLGEPDVDRYVVIMKDGDIVEVLPKEYAGAYRRVSGKPAPVPAAPQR